MNNTEYMVIAFVAGLALGAVFFGGLWLTVKKALNSKNTALWFSGSSLFRTVIVLFGFYYAASASWQRLLVCMAGFIVARFVVIWITKAIDTKHITLKNGA